MESIRPLSPKFLVAFGHVHPTRRTKSPHRRFWTEESRSVVPCTRNPGPRDARDAHGRGRWRRSPVPTGWRRARTRSEPNANCARKPRRQPICPETARTVVMRCARIER